LQKQPLAEQRAEKKKDEYLVSLKETFFSSHDAWNLF
jgi:hypothetical protein